MNRKDGKLRAGRDGVARMVAGVLLASAVWGGAAAAQTCTTQAKMSAELRQALADEALALASDVKANDAAKVQAATVAEYAANFAPTAYLVRTTAEKLGADSLAVTHVYALDATARKAGDTSDANFTCLLVGTTSEVDFSIGGLPPGMYGFAIVQAEGPRPWTLAFLLEKQGSGWKMAGFYSHARTAAAHDGLWYWNAARDAAKGKDLWRAWVLYGEASSLLQPAAFLDSTHLDKLHTEQRGATPPEIADGLSAETPLAVKAADGTEFRFTGISSEASDDGQRLNLMVHLRAEPLTDAVAGRSRNAAAAKALLTAHKELRQGFDGVWVFAETPGQPPFATEEKMSEIP